MSASCQRTSRPQRYGSRPVSMNSGRTTMPTIDLPDGHTADLRDVGDLRRGDVRFALKAADDEGINLFGAGMGLSGIGTLQDALIVRFVRRWDLTNDDGEPLEVSLASVQDLPVKYHKPLAAVVTPALAEIGRASCRERVKISVVAVSLK